MTATAPRTKRRPAEGARRSGGARVLQIVGWTLISAGAIVLLYVVYSLFFTNLETDAAQAELLEDWEATVPAPGAIEDDGAAEPEDASETTAEPSPGSGDAPPTPDIGGAVAMLEFVRPGGADTPVRDDPLLVVDGVSREALMRGPGHYPLSALPGEDGNFAVAGHRTTYGAPFFRLEELRAGDEIHVTDRSGTRHVYAFVEQRVVGPQDSWVIDRDPLERGSAMLTLTTCHPRFSARQRLIVFAELLP